MTASDFAQTCAAQGVDIQPDRVGTMQLNITRLCNQSCAHCHVDASPNRSEMMDRPTIDSCLAALDANPEIGTVDITGGAPELNPLFTYVVDGAIARGRRVKVRHNLTVTTDPHPLTGESMQHLPEFFARREVELISSLPCYLESNCDAQRGTGVHEKSIASLRRLNALGYGMPGSGLTIDLVHNPTGFGLPGNQRALEADYRGQLATLHDAYFDRLLTITNVPVNRFESQLSASGQLSEYESILRSRFNPAALHNLMCRSQVSVAWDGALFDCDFNQAAGVPSAMDMTVDRFDADRFAQRSITFGRHCFACAAGTGSGCDGALT